ncbi:MAG TPA: glycosyltransferase [Vicinamibacterales bacterium]|nr:glycosyltransferase [Vicinamibacterales bacterium]
MPPLTLLHAIHDFLPRHRAGSEIYACALARALSARHDVTVLCAEFDAARPHGCVTWRVEGELPVVEIVNNWRCESFADTYRPPLVGERIAHVLDTIAPQIVHVHSLFNLSFALPALARSRGIAVVATLHDYTLVCPSGGQRVHRADRYVCHVIDPDRCARCFGESPFAAQMSIGRLVSAAPRLNPMPAIARAVRRRLPVVAERAAAMARQAAPPAVTRADIERRLSAAREVFDQIDLFVAPSRSMADEYVRLGLPASRIEVADYGFAPLPAAPRRAHDGPLRIGFVGTLVWHKGAHVLIDAARLLPAGRFEIHLAGDVDVFPDYVRGLRRAAEGLPVRFAGSFDRDRVAEIYAGIDVLVVPSIWLENSPLVIHEAFMAGVPVVGARIGGIPGLVEDGVNGRLYDPHSPADLARVLAELIARPDGGRALAAAATGVRAIDDDAARWEEIYRAAAARTRAGSARTAMR